MRTHKFHWNAFLSITALGVLCCLMPCFGQNAVILPKPPVSINDYIPEAQRIAPMPLSERMKREVVPVRGLVSIAPGVGKNDLLKSGNGKMNIDVFGNPTSDIVIFRHERLQLPWKTPLEAPKIASALPEVKKLLLDGKYKEGLDLSLKTAADAGTPAGTKNHGNLEAFTMKIDMAKEGEVKNYLRTVDFESGEIKVLWDDNRGSWERSSFVSRPDNVVVQQLSAPKDKLLNAQINIVIGKTVLKPTDRIYNSNQVPETVNVSVPADADPTKQSFDRDFNDQRLIVMGRFIEPGTGNKGYAGVVRVVLNGGSASVKDGILVIQNAKSVLLLTRIEWFSDFQRGNVDELVSSLGKIVPDYQVLLTRTKKDQSAIFDRASLDFAATKEENALSGEELLVDQKEQMGYNRVLLSKMFDMGRYWQMLESGDFPPMYGNLNSNVVLQVSGGNMANLPEAMNPFYSWIEKSLPDAKTNARNIFGSQGALFTAHPDHETAALYNFSNNMPNHYRTSVGGWVYNIFWDRYLVTGDKTFLRDHVMPGLRELGLFYESYLTEKDTKGNYIFVPSYSPDNGPVIAGASGGGMMGRGGSSNIVMNASVDIMVCKEVLSHLIEGAEVLGTDAASIPKWKALLAKMPPYLLDNDGALKEWAWPTYDERLDVPNISHMYGVWPADEIDPDRTPELARAAWIANRKHAQGNQSGFGISHRMLAAARLKDNYLVNYELKQLLQQGFVGPVLTTSHNPYTVFMPDQQGSILTALMEMLVYSREGVIELLPALPTTLDKGSVKGILSRSFAHIDQMSWDLKTKTIELTITSLKDQDITLIDRHGIESVIAPDGVLKSKPAKDSMACVLHLQQVKPTTIRLKLGNRKPSDWILSQNTKN